MNMIGAAEKTMEVARERMKKHVPHKSELSLIHLEEMLTKMRATDMSKAKMGRWLGWMQAAVVAATDLSLEDMKNINRKFAS